MDLSIIIVNWNSAEYTRKCIATVRAFTHDIASEIIVVDNASTDDSLLALEQIAGIRLIKSSRNVGFAKANNIAAEASSGRILLFLNPDTELTGPAINCMYGALTLSPTIGIVGCKLLNSDGSVQTSCVQPFPTILNQFADVEKLKQCFPRLRLWGTQALHSEASDIPVPVEIVSGACLMIRRDVFEEVAGFSTRYFMYGEDMDLCYKVRQAGLHVAYVSAAAIVHHGGQSSKHNPDPGFGDVLTRRAIWMFLQQTRGRLYGHAYRAAMGIAALIRLAILCVAAIPAFLVRGVWLRHTFCKWTRVLRWSLGLEHWTNRLGVMEPARISES